MRRIAAALLMFSAALTLTGCDTRTKNCVRVAGELNIPGILEQYQWLGDSGNFDNHCGTVQHFENDGRWEAYAWDDDSRIHYFPDQASAEKWVEDNWCVLGAPVAPKK